MQFYGVLLFGIEGHGDARALAHLLKHHVHRAAIREGVGEALQGHHLGVGGLIVEAEAAVLGLHAGHVAAAHHQIIGGRGAVPGVYGLIPLRDVLRQGVALPGFWKAGCYKGVDGDGGHGG